MILMRVIRNIILDEKTDNSFISSYNRFGHLASSIQITTDVLLNFARIDDSFGKSSTLFFHSLTQGH